MKWAKCNVGAESETDYGYYFQWGDIEDKSNSDCSWSTYKHGDGSNFSKYNTSSEYGKNPDGKTTLDPEDDTASQIMGDNWRMPTITEFEELVNNTTKEWTQVNDVYGYKFTGSNGKYIFFPTSGHRSESTFSGEGTTGGVWSSSLYTSSPTGAFNLYFNSLFIFTSGQFDRCYGLPVRGVCN